MLRVRVRRERLRQYAENGFTPLFLDWLFHRRPRRCRLWSKTEPLTPTPARAWKRIGKTRAAPIVIRYSIPLEWHWKTLTRWDDFENRMAAKPWMPPEPLPMARRGVTYPNSNKIYANIRTPS